MTWAKPSWPIGEPGPWRDEEDITGPLLYGRIGGRLDDLATQIQALGNCGGFFAQGIRKQTQQNRQQLPIADTGQANNRISGGVYEAGDTIYYPTPGLYLLVMHLFKSDISGNAKQLSGRELLEWRTGLEAESSHQTPFQVNGWESSVSVRALVPVVDMSVAYTTLYVYSDDSSWPWWSVSVAVARCVELP